ncbi:MAG: SprT-like family [Herbinix sp.]|jgi:hypothetical protein|nr:SprT-like family [Herbinix sp.]
MEEITDYPVCAEYLKKLYWILNDKYFEGKLTDIIITIQDKAGTFGHFSLGKVWKIENVGERHEINICSTHLNRPIKGVISTLLHEMTHYYDFLNGIKDVSANGVYHNKEFKTAAEARGLLISKHPRYGWTITEPSPELIAWIEQMGFVDVALYRKGADAGSGGGIGGTGGGEEGGIPGGEGKKKSSTRKYRCPCGVGIRATKDVLVICGCCGGIFEKVD